MFDLSMSMVFSEIYFFLPFFLFFPDPFPPFDDCAFKANFCSSTFCLSLCFGTNLQTSNSRAFPVKVLVSIILQRESSLRALTRGNALVDWCAICLLQFHSNSSSCKEISWIAFVLDRSTSSSEKVPVALYPITSITESNFKCLQLSFISITLGSSTAAIHKQVSVLNTSQEAHPLFCPLLQPIPPSLPCNQMHKRSSQTQWSSHPLSQSLPNVLFTFLPLLSDRFLSIYAGYIQIHVFKSDTLISLPFADMMLLSQVT